MINLCVGGLNHQLLLFLNCTWFRGQKTVSSVLCNSSLDDPLLQPTHVVVS